MASAKTRVDSRANGATANPYYPPQAPAVSAAPAEEDVEIKKRSQRIQFVYHARSPGLATFFSLVWPGLGNIYAEQVLFGLIMAFFWPIVTTVFGYTLLMITGTIAARSNSGGMTMMVFILSLVVIFILWALTLISAYSAANEYNRRMESRFR